jgi:FkbM family methyltransferase
MSWTPPFTLGERLKLALVPPGLYMAYRLRKERRRGERELALLPFLVDPRRAALDVGANKGVWTHALARLCPEVLAFEPNPKTFAMLERLKPPNCRTFALAASDSDGEAVLRVPRYAGGRSNQHASLSATRVPGPHGEVVVRQARLDGLDLPPIGFIKLDVEGFEEKVLDGAAALIARDRPVMVVELEERHTGRPIAAMLADVEARGYRALALHRGRLVLASALDMEACHRAPAARADYVFNFVFLPRS